MIYCGAGYLTLDDLENRLDGAIQRGELTEQEVWDEFQEATARERYEQEMIGKQFVEEYLILYLVNMIYKDSSDEVKREKYNLFYDKLDEFFSGKIPFKDVINTITADIE